MTFFRGQGKSSKRGGSSLLHNIGGSRQFHDERTITLRRDDNNHTGDNSLSSRNIHEGGRSGQGRRTDRSRHGFIEKSYNRESSGPARHRSRGEISMEIDEGNTAPQQRSSSLRGRGRSRRGRGQRISPSSSSFPDRLSSLSGDARRGGRGGRGRGGKFKNRGGSRSSPREHLKAPPEPFGAGAISPATADGNGKLSSNPSNQNIGKMSRSKLSKDMLDKDLDSFMLKDSKTGQAVLDADIEKYMSNA